MNDLNCKQCGEPYSAYSLRNEIPEWDNEPDDAYEQFMEGKGCPTCDWGEKAGDVSLSESQTQAEVEARHFKSIMENSDDDPTKYI